MPECTGAQKGAKGSAFRIVRPSLRYLNLDDNSLCKGRLQVEVARREGFTYVIWSGSAIRV